MAGGAAFDVVGDGGFHSRPPVVVADQLGGFGDSWVACHWGVMVEGNYPPSKWEIVHNDQAVAIPGKSVNCFEGKGGFPALEVMRGGQLTNTDAVVNGGEGCGL